MGHDLYIDDDTFYLYYLDRLTTELLLDELHYLELRGKSGHADDRILATTADRLIHRGKLFPRRVPESNERRRCLLVN